MIDTIMKQEMLITFKYLSAIETTRFGKPSALYDAQSEFNKPYEQLKTFSKPQFKCKV